MKHKTHWILPQHRLMPKALKGWLTDQGSLTRRLQAVSQNKFSVDLLNNCWRRPLYDERVLLQLPLSQLAFEREVRLMDGDKAMVYARTIVPIATYQAMKQRFFGLGTRPLGELLFTEPEAVRGPLEIAKLLPGQFLYEKALRLEQVKPAQLWARRSVFYISGKALLINEIFLPTVEWS